MTEGIQAIIVVRVADNFELVGANSRFYEMFETTKEDYIDGVFARFGNTDRLMYTNYLHNQAIDGGDISLVIKTVKKKTDELVWINVQVKCINEKEHLYLAAITDITKEKNLSNEIEEIRNLYLKAISSSDEMIFEYQVEEDIFVYYKLVEENGSIVNKPNFRTGFLQNLEQNKDVYPDDLVYFYDLGRDNIAHPFDVRFRRSDQKPGEYTRMRVHATTQKDAGKVKRIIGTVRPVEEMKSVGEATSLRSDKDELTGVNTKSKAKQCIEEYLLNSTVASSFALLILDVKGFKQVNDVFGHMFGDNVLVQVADCIIENIKRSDIVGRLGGDEFIIFIKNASKSATQGICDKICRGIRNIYAGEDISVDASIGGVVVTDPSRTYDELLRTADNALFELITENKTGCKLVSEILAKPQGALKRSYVADRNVRALSDSKEKRLSELIFELLEQAKDVDRALDTVLGLVGERKNLSRISIMRRDGDKLLVTKQWVSRGIKPRSSMEDHELLKYHEKMQNNFSEDGMGVINLEIANKYAPEKAMKMLAEGAKSIMYCNMMEFGEVVGVIAFVDCKTERDWTDIDYKAYRTITRMISAYTLKTEAIKKM